MNYECYLAICHPLRYLVIMSTSLCILLIIFLMFFTVDVLIHSLMALWLSFCTNLDITNFFCELPQIIKLSHSTLIDNILIYVSSCIFVDILLSKIIFSYVHILSSVLRMPSLGGKYKVLSTCGSHLSVVFLFYGAGFEVYISSIVTVSSKKTVAASVMYSVVTQMLNPLPTF
jgi:olfactory receptor